MKVWISKYALKAGLYEEEILPHEDGIVSTRKGCLFHPGEWHLTRASSAENMTAIRRMRKGIHRIFCGERMH